MLWAMPTPELTPVEGEVPDLYIIAEVGVNHDGDLADAHALIDVASACGADAVKFQTFKPESLVSGVAEAAPYQQVRAQARSQLELLNRYVLPDSAWTELVAHAHASGIEFLSTAFDSGSLDLVCDLGVRALKLGSGELTNKPLLVEAARRGLPVICSTGMATEAEVADAVEWLSPAPELTLMHCVSSYPAPVEQANLRAIVTMRDRFKVAVGWSDHTVGSVTAVAAVALGARALEKHITLDTQRQGPDHAASADPESFARYVMDARSAHSSLGTGVKTVAPAEEENVGVVRRSWHAARDLRAGERIGAEDIALLRPGRGISPRQDIAGRKVRRPVSLGHFLVEEDLVPQETE